MPDEAVIRRYLLGETSEEEGHALERGYFAQEERLDEVGAVEADLLEDYLAGRLPGPSRTRFETHYLRTPEHRRRLAMARALHAEARPAHRTRKVLYFFPLAAAAILVLAVLAVVWGLRLPGGPHPPQAGVLALQVPLVAVRGEGEAPTAHLGTGAGVQALELRLEQGAATPPYALLLRTVEGEEVWRGEAAAEPIFRIPAAGLPAGDYVAELTSVGRATPPQRYSLRVLRP
ncbi:MAG TPA: hypothetical protein VFV75_07625 [Candidatus Polarisedimenticolaceae bacterium]|nr:hypothetical protein [Candidatus Polarisedimenticolaceae bacterium]